MKRQVIQTYIAFLLTISAASSVDAKKGTEIMTIKGPNGGIVTTGQKTESGTDLVTWTSDDADQGSERAIKIGNLNVKRLQDRIDNPDNPVDAQDDQGTGLIRPSGLSSNDRGYQIRLEKIALSIYESGVDVLNLQEVEDQDLRKGMKATKSARWLSRLNFLRRGNGHNDIMEDLVLYINAIAESRGGPARYRTTKLPNQNKNSKLIDLSDQSGMGVAYIYNEDVVRPVGPTVLHQGVRKNNDPKSKSVRKLYPRPVMAQKFRLQDHQKRNFAQRFLGLFKVDTTPEFWSVNPHMKAGTDENRALQLEEQADLAEFSSKLAKEAPVVAAGDFNKHAYDNDNQFVANVSKGTQVNLVNDYIPEEFGETFNSGNKAFDWIAVVGKKGSFSVKSASIYRIGSEGTKAQGNAATAVAATDHHHLVTKIGFKPPKGTRPIIKFLGRLTGNR